MEADNEENDVEGEERVAAESVMETEKDARNWAIFCHLSAFLVFLIPLGNVLGPLAIWLIKRNDYAFVNNQGKAVLNFQFSMTIYGLIAVIFLFGLFYTSSRGFDAMDSYMFLIALFIMAIQIAYSALIIMAAAKSNKGILYKYPLAIEFLK